MTDPKGSIRVGAVAPTMLGTCAKSGELKLAMTELKVTRPIVASRGQLAAIGCAIRRQTCRVVGGSSGGLPPPPTTACPATVCPARPAIGPPTRVVSTGTPCLAGLPTYITVQAAVDASGSGDVIAICPGTYAEQVIIVTGGITLISTTPHAAIIQAPPILGGNGAIIEVNGAQGVNIFDLTIRGPGAIQGQLNYGIYVIGGGSADIDNNIIQSIRDNPVSGGQHGTGVRVGRQVDGEVGAAIITRNIITDYQKNGVTVDNAGSGAYVGCNTITGLGPTPVIANNGVQVSRGALATVEGNVVTDNDYTGNPANGTAAGIYLYQASTPGIIVRGNRLRNNYNSIVLQGDADVVTTGTLITCNIVLSSVQLGIVLASAPGAAPNLVVGNVVRMNTVAGSGQYDLADTSVGGRSCCSGNDWLSNVATSDNRGGCLVTSTGVVPPTTCPPLMLPSPPPNLTFLV